MKRSEAEVDMRDFPYPSRERSGWQDFETRGLGEEEIFSLPQTRSGLI
jgi:hypothetical protein